ncbi:hypothetical protein J6590_036722 [Homalodisca vitripennis]|nr:hypothetical protein J6590_036722 [Homalodisca vitripennis]
MYETSCIMCSKSEVLERTFTFDIQPDESEGEVVIRTRAVDPATLKMLCLSSFVGKESAKKRARKTSYLWNAQKQIRPVTWSITAASRVMTWLGQKNTCLINNTQPLPKSGGARWGGAVAFITSADIVHRPHTLPPPPPPPLLPVTTSPRMNPHFKLPAHRGILPPMMIDTTCLLLICVTNPLNYLPNLLASGFENVKPTIDTLIFYSRPGGNYSSDSGAGDGTKNSAFLQYYPRNYAPSFKSLGPLHQELSHIRADGRKDTDGLGSPPESLLHPCLQYLEPTIVILSSAVNLVVFASCPMPPSGVSHHCASIIYPISALTNPLTCTGGYMSREPKPSLSLSLFCSDCRIRSPDVWWTCDRPYPQTYRTHLHRGVTNQGSSNNPDQKPRKGITTTLPSSPGPVSLHTLRNPVDRTDGYTEKYPHINSLRRHFTVETVTLDRRLETPISKNTENIVSDEITVMCTKERQTTPTPRSPETITRRAINEVYG